MYKRDPYFRKYCRSYRRRKKRITLLKKVFSCFLSLSLVCASLYIWHSLPVLEAFAAPEKEFTEVEKALLGLVNAGQMAFAEEETAEEPETVPEESGVPTVFLDPGHGGADEGCQREGVQEKTINLAIAKIVKSQLETLGYRVILSREEDIYMAKEDRVKAANDS